MKLSQLQPNLEKTAPQSAFDVEAAQNYNTKSEHFFKNYADEIKQILGTSADWKSPEFAKMVYDWQGRNGFTNRLLDGKFGPLSMARMAKNNTSLAKKYDPYAVWKAKHMDEKPHKRVISLMGEVDRIRKEMGAENIPLQLLLGWIQSESGGKLNSITTSAGFKEAGLFQISEEEAKSIGVDQDRVLVDREYAIRSGIKLAQHHAGQVDRVLEQHPRMKQFLPQNSDMYWRMAFFSFSAGPSSMAKLIGSMDASRESFGDWRSVMDFAAYNSAGYKHSPTKWLAHNERAWNMGGQIVGEPKKAVLRVERVRKEAMILVKGNK